MYLRILFFFTFIINSNSIINAQENVDYYRHMVFRASPYGSLMGRYPVGSDKVGFGAHFRIFKEENGRVSKIEYWFRNKLTRGGYNRFGAIAGAARLTFKYEDNKIIRSYLDEQGKPMLNYWKVAVEEIELDDKGYKKSMIYKDLSGNRVEDSRGVWVMNWQVSEDGKEVIEERTGKDGKSRRFNNFLDFGRVKMIFDERGLRWETWNIDDKGNRINSEKRKVAGVYTKWDVSSLDEKQITWVDTNGNPKNVEPFEVMKGNYGFCTEIYEHDANGYNTGVVKYDAEGDLVTPDSDNNVFSRSIYDNYGFLIDQRYFNSAGIPSLNDNGVARIELIRNKARLVIEVRFYGLDGKLKNRNEDGVASIKLKYDENEQLIEIKNFDLEGNEVIK
ncbi:hypothetical protein [Pontimicrobium aquaticum]|uniref:Uncharacterized protein n=1 Tax=Pontimicrobium aquaticum TaxID=2565367 RepID=A0A4U0EYP3_9FLAO|nr:hypothetical protein [Pontimicrobium aquaticum]TJY37060.1 hypothetical protein E5167_03700 [Pontimicrobium aquaticum]